MQDHKQFTKEIFDRAAPLYGGAIFSYFGRRLVEQMKFKSNQHVLDVATGRGAVLFPLIEALGPSGKVIGIDISDKMIQETSQELRKKKNNQAELFQMDAEDLHFPDSSFDFVFCGFALFFFPSIQKALSEFKRVLKVDGKLVVSTWGKGSELKRWLDLETKNYGFQRGLAITPLWNKEALQQTLEKGGFKEIQVVEERRTFFHCTPEEWWKSLWSHGTRARLEQLSPDQLADLQEKALLKAAALQTKEGIPEELQVFFGIAAAHGGKKHA